MLKKIAMWFLVFGLSFLVSDIFQWTEQGKAFLYIHLGSVVLLILVALLVLIVTGASIGFAREVNGISLLIALYTVATVAFVLFFTWIATLIFDVDFYVTYQIMTFGQCLCSSSSKKEKKNSDDFFA